MKKLRLSLGSALLIVSLSGLPATAAETVRINPESLRKLTLEGNNPILLELNQVYQAKDAVNSARAGILPGANLGVMLKNQVGPTFIVSSVSFLLPFLLPSNWFAIKQNNHLLEAEKDSYQLMQLNQYASVYAIYETILGDVELRSILESQYQNLKSIADLLSQQNRETGSASAADVKQALAQAQGALVQLSQMDELLAQEKAAMRQALGLPLDTDIQFDAVHVAASPVESAEPSKLLDQALAIAPESRQINELLAAAKSGKWKSLWAFLSGSTLATSSSNSSGVTGPASFSSLTQSNTVNLGFSTFPAIQLSNDQIASMALHQRDLRLSEGRILESSLASLAEAEAQLEIQKQSEQNMQQSYLLQVRSYTLGFTDLLHVLTAQSQVTAAATARVKVQIDLDNLRINLHRVMLSDQFASIPGCQLNRNPAKPKGKSGPFQWIAEIFSSSASHASVDDACRGH